MVFLALLISHLFNHDSVPRRHLFFSHLEHLAQGLQLRSPEKKLVVGQLNPGLLRLCMPLPLQTVRVCVGVKIHTDLLLAWSPTIQQERKYPFLKSYKSSHTELRGRPTTVPSSLCGSIHLIPKNGCPSADQVSSFPLLPQLCHPEAPPSVCQPTEEMGARPHQLFGDELG